MKLGMRFKGHFTTRCFDPQGNLKWTRKAQNTVLDAALDSILNVYLHAATQITTWYVGLIDDTPTIDHADVMTDHSGWTENTKYAGNRKEFVEAAASAATITNVASPAAFVMNDTTTVSGAFLCGAATGTSCLLFCAALFDEGDAVVGSGDTINVVYEITGADAGA
jgi:hypothetical protein